MTKTLLKQIYIFVKTLGLNQNQVPKLTVIVSLLFYLWPYHFLKKYYVMFIMKMIQDIYFFKFFGLQLRTDK